MATSQTGSGRAARLPGQTPALPQANRESGQADGRLGVTSPRIISPTHQRQQRYLSRSARTPRSRPPS